VVVSSGPTAPDDGDGESDRAADGVDDGDAAGGPPTLPPGERKYTAPPIATTIATAATAIRAMGFIEGVLHGTHIGCLA
jgi:hypothetical protein